MGDNIHPFHTLPIQTEQKHALYTCTDLWDYEPAMRFEVKKTSGRRGREECTGKPAECERHIPVSSRHEPCARPQKKKRVGGQYVDVCFICKNATRTHTTTPPPSQGEESITLEGTKKETIISHELSIFFLISER